MSGVARLKPWSARALLKRESERCSDRPEKANCQPGVARFHNGMARFENGMFKGKGQ